MFVLLFVLLLFVENGYTLMCMTNCSVGEFSFDQLFRIPDGRCQQRILTSSCSIDLTFEYHKQKYSAQFDHSLLSRDFIYITAGPYLSYDVHYRCSKETNCALSYAQNRVYEMVGRTYNAAHIYGRLAPIIENPLRNDSIQCYNTRNEIIMCLSNQVCAMEYDLQANKIKSRGCESYKTPRIFVHDGESYSYFHVECNRDLCNTDEIYTQIKTIFANNRLTDANGRRIAAGIKEMASTLLVIYALIFTVVSYF